MKKSLFFWFSFLWVILMFSLILSGCKSTQPINNIEKKDSIVSNDKKVNFTNTIDRSKSINDAFAFTLPTIKTGATKIQDCDSLCNQRLKDALASINVSKKSGDNGYSISFDKYKNELDINTHLGETIKQLKDSISTTNKNTKVTDIHTIDVPVDKPLTKLQKFLITSGVISWILLIAVVGWKGYKKINPIA